MSSVQINNRILIRYRILDAAGLVLEDSGEAPVAITVGDGSLPTLVENALLGRKIGEDIRIEVDAADGVFGRYDESKIQPLPRSQFGDFGEIENLQVSAKGPGDFVTSADKRTEKILIEELQKAHPNYGIITEETGIINKTNTKNRWIIDPIDGTFNFMNGIPQFAISVGYEEENEMKCGVIFNPIMNEMFCAEKGNGAYLNNSRIRVSNKKKIKDCCIVTGGPKGASKIKEKIFSEYINVSNNVSNVRKFGSAALDVAYVACGRFDGYWQRELNVWDIAAGVIILKEAGGFVDFFEEDKR